MNTFAVLFVCVQACLVQTAFSQCLNPGYGFITPSNYVPGAICAYGYGAGLGDLAYPAGLGGIYPGSLAGAYPGYAGCGLDAYGGAGEGNVAVAGELPVAGATAVAGQVPILGAVTFGGDVLAGGTVSIAGNCACSCGSPYGF